MSPFLGPLERLVLIRDGYYAPDPPRSRRAAMLLALDRGATASAVARAAGCCRTTVYYWLRLYKKHRDPAALSGDYPRGPVGGPRRAAARIDRLAARSGRRTGQGGASPDANRALAEAIDRALARGVAVSRIAAAAGVSPQAIRRGAERRAARGRR